MSLCLRGYIPITPGSDRFPAFGERPGDADKSDGQHGQHSELRHQRYKRLSDRRVDVVVPEDFQEAVQRPAVEVNNAAVSMNFGMTKRGTMLPPKADITRMTTREIPFSCARLVHAVARTSPNPAAAAAVTTAIAATPAILPGVNSSRWNPNEAHRNMRLTSTIPRAVR